MSTSSDRAPQFKLKNEDDEWIDSEALYASGPILIAFYPGDFTLVCTKQLCGYQNALASFEKLNIKLVGISSDPPEKHRDFKSTYQLKFTLLSDPGRVVAKAFGATSPFLFGATSRAVFIVDKMGHILYKKVEMVPVTHQKADELISVIEALNLKPNA